jgi:hypothetical protein
LGYGGGGAATVPIVPGFSDVQASGRYGPGIVRYGSGQLPDFAFDVDNSPHAITVGQALGGLIAHPWTGNDSYLYFGYEHADETAPLSVASGYGSPLLDNTGCFVEGGTCTVAAAVPATTTPPITAAKPATGAETETLKQVTGGFWQDIYTGRWGRFILGMQRGVIWRDAFRGVGGAPDTDIGIFLSSLRYYPFQQ